MAPGAADRGAQIWVICAHTRVVGRLNRRSVVRNGCVCVGPVEPRV